MPCGCGSAGGQAVDRFEVRPNDGSGVKRFASRADADVYAARTGGIVKPLVKAG
jgi:hypothetical protein